jgi:hypothetical protein
MMVYTYSEARQNLASLLEKAAQEGEVRIKRKDGQVFVIKPQTAEGSPLDIDGVELGITTTEILKAIQDGRRTF